MSAVEHFPCIDSPGGCGTGGTGGGDTGGVGDTGRVEVWKE